MGLLDGLLKQRTAARFMRDAEQLLSGAERIELNMDTHVAASRAKLVTETAGLALDKLLEADRAGFNDRDHFNMRHAQALLLLRRADEALTPALAAAHARPYDVDSRIIHGRIRLALGQLREAAHEFASILEEFGREADAMDGLRATSLARGELVYEAEDTDAERARGADLLLSAWDAAGAIQQRLDELSRDNDNAGTGSPVMRVLLDALARRDGTTSPGQG
jgi:tetratricopeptide (TPR) repeat protein